MNLLLVLLFALPAPPRQQQPFTAANARDSTIMAVQNVGQRVADVRGDLEHFRMLLVTDSLASGAHAEAADALKRACDSLTVVAAQSRRMMCTRCMGSGLQGAFNGYRDYLPAVATMSRRCAARLDRTRIASASPSVKRQVALDLSTLIVSGLRPYERHVSAVLEAMRAPVRRRVETPPPSGRP